MDVTELVTKAMNDIDFMYEVFTHIPDSMGQSEDQASPDARGQLVWDLAGSASPARRPWVAPLPRTS